MPLSNFKRPFAALSLAAAFAVASSQSGLAINRVETSPSAPAAKSAPVNKSKPADKRPEKLPQKRHSANEFFTLAPFVIPIIENGEHAKQFVLVVAIELGEDGDRDELRILSPRMRNEIYQLLFKIVSFRTTKPRIPSKKILQMKLTKAVRRVPGLEKVESLVIVASGIADVQ